MERLDVCTEELAGLLEQARREPLAEDGYRKLKAAIDTLAYVTELLAKKETSLAALRELLPGDEREDIQSAGASRRGWGPKEV